MPKESIKSKVEEFVTHSSELGETAFKLVQLNAIQKTSNISANMIFTIFSAILSIITLLFCSAAASWWLGDLLHSRIYGFLILGGFYLLLLACIVLLKGKYILPYLRNKIVKKIYE